MLILRNFLVALGLLSGLPPLYAADLLETETSWDGGPIAYPAGMAKVTSIILHLDQDEVTPWHCHPVPTMGYVLKGSIEVETREGKKTFLSGGESVVEVMKTLHRGKGGAGGVDVVVFYAGATGVPNTVLHEESASAEYCLQDRRKHLLSDSD